MRLAGWAMGTMSVEEEAGLLVKAASLVTTRHSEH
jgi:hypothetical protein